MQGDGYKACRESYPSTSYTINILSVKNGLDFKQPAFVVFCITVLKLILFFWKS